MTNLRDLPEHGQKAVHLQKSFELPSDHPHMDGHFDNFKLLPGASQIQFVMDILRSHFGDNIFLREIPRAKFTKMVRPLSTLHLSMQVEEDVARWTASVSGEMVSRGVVVFALVESL